MVLGGAALTCFTAARAELPPDVYRARQSATPEFLEIKVRSVTSKKVHKGEEIAVAHTVEADVQKVARTASGLKPGNLIKIEYTQSTSERPMVGPSEVPTLKEGQVYPAYLSRHKGEDTYTPAAGGFSFETVSRK